LSKQPIIGGFAFAVFLLDNWFILFIQVIMNSATKIVLVVLGVVVLVGVVIVSAVVGYNMANPNNQKVSPTPTAQVSPSVTAGVTISVTPNTSPTVSTSPSPTVSITTEVTPPSGWQPIDNTSQKYIAYRPSGWYFKMFAPNMQLLGVDKNKIPDASEYAGMFTIQRLTGSSTLQAAKDNLDPGFSETTQEISGRTWTIIKGKQKLYEESGMGGAYVKLAYVNVSGKEFIAQLQSTSSGFGGQESNFDIFVKTIKFY